MDALIAAHEINGLWLKCLQSAGVQVIPDDCPSDQRVAAVIEKHIRSDEEREEKNA